MKLQELKLEALKRGFIFAEKLNDQDKNFVEINVSKWDTDGLFFQSNVRYDYNGYNEIPLLKLHLKRSIEAIDLAITARHNNNINTCHHDPINIMHSTRRVCRFCMGKLGDNIIIDLKPN